MGAVSKSQLSRANTAQRAGGRAGGAFAAVNLQNEAAASHLFEVLLRGKGVDNIASGTAVADNPKLLDDDMTRIVRVCDDRGQR